MLVDKTINTVENMTDRPDRTILPTIPVPEDIANYAIAFYQRDHLDKIIALIYPSIWKIIYTPFGIQQLHLNANRLPTLTQILPQLSTMVAVPYRKGRSKEEVQSLLAPPTAGINDIYEPPAVRNVNSVGDPDALLFKNDLIKCMKFRIGVVNVRYQRSTDPDWVQFKAMAKDNFGIRVSNQVRQAARHIKLNGQDPPLQIGSDHVIISTLTISEVVENLSRCPSIVGYIVAGFRGPLGQMGDSKTGHAFAIMWDKNRAEAELIDSNGITPDYYDFILHWFTWLVTEVNGQQAIQFTIVHAVTAGYCPQWYASFTRESERNYGQCLAWSWYYLWLRANNPSKDSQQLIRYIMSMDAKQLQDKIERVNAILYQDYEFGSLEQFLNIKTLLTSGSAWRDREEVAMGLRYLMKEEDPLACYANSVLIGPSNVEKDAWLVDGDTNAKLIIRQAQLPDYLLGLQLNELNSRHYQYCYAFRSNAEITPEGITYQISNNSIILLEYVPGLTLREALRQHGWASMAATVARCLRIIDKTYKTAGYVLDTITLDSIIIRPDEIPVLLLGRGGMQVGDSRLVILQQLREELPNEDILFIPDQPLLVIEKRYPAVARKSTQTSETGASSSSVIPFSDSVALRIMQRKDLPPTIQQEFDVNYPMVLANTEPIHYYHVLQTIYLYLRSSKVTNPRRREYWEMAQQRMTQMLNWPDAQALVPLIQWLQSKIVNPYMVLP